MSKVLRLTLSVRIFEQLAAEADAARIPSVELVRRFLSTRYEQQEAASAGWTGAEARRPNRGRVSADLREGNAIFGQSIDAYGRIDRLLEKIPTTPAGRKQLAAISGDLQILGDGIALLRELLDLVEELRQACAPRQEAMPRPLPHAANDQWLPA